MTLVSLLAAIVLWREIIERLSIHLLINGQVVLEVCGKGNKITMGELLSETE